MCFGPECRMDRISIPSRLVTVEHGAVALDQANPDVQRGLACLVGDFARSRNQGRGPVEIARLHSKIGLHGERVTELHELIRVVGFDVEHRHRLDGMAFGEPAVRVVPLVHR